MSVVTTAHLEQWANRVDARHMSGELIRRLIHASVPMASISMIRFLANEATQLSGWDGVLSCSSSIPWIPDGNSVWELGVGANDKAKVKSDFKKRKNADLPDGWVRTETTYVAVSFRKFNNKTDLEKELKGLGIWKDVSIIDSAAMEEWIENFYGVQAWLKEQGVIPYVSIESLTGFWGNWANKTEPEITEALLLHAREEQGQQFWEQFVEEDAYFTIRSDSPEESLAFSYAVISNHAIEEEKDNFLSKCVVINNVDDARKLEHVEQHFVFLINSAVSQVRALARYGHKVILANGRRIPTKTPAEIQLNRLLHGEFTEGLQQLGLNEGESQKDSRACGSSIGIWRVWNQLDIGISDEELPNWAKDEYAESVIPAVLAGGWDESSQGDIEIMEKLAGCAYHEYCTKLQTFLNHDNPLLVKVGDSWVVTASATAFALIVQHINRFHLNKFEEVVTEVFSEIDPRLELPAEERGMANIKGITVKHTDWLRDGLAETLLKISVLGDRLEENSAIREDKQTYVNRIVSGLRALSDDIRVITSLRNQMPVLAEAAPIPFMEALDSLIQGYPEQIKNIFEGKDGFSSHSYHSYFLWSLETLAWEPKYFPRVCLILLELAALDPGGQTSNRPINSLKEIFLSWSPGTAASIDTRMKVLELLVDKNANVTWELMKGLFPKYQAISHPTSNPKWKDFSRSDITQLTRGEVYKANVEHLKLGISLAGDIANRWLDLIDIYSLAPVDQRKKIILGLENLATSMSDIEVRMSLWNALRKETNKHKGFPDAQWAMTNEQILLLEELLPLFENPDIKKDCNWLFDEHRPDIGLPRTNFREEKEEIQKMRTSVLSEILNANGAKELLALAENVRFPHFVVHSIAEEFIDFNFFEDCAKYFNFENKANVIFFTSLSQRLLKLFGDDWSSYIVASKFYVDLEHTYKAKLFFDYPDTFDTFEFIQSLGADVEAEYWSNRPAWLSKDFPEILLYVSNKFIEFGRSIELPMVIAYSLDKLPEDYGFKLLEDIYNHLSSEETIKLLKSQAHYISDIFEGLKTASADIQRLAKLEYKYLPMLHQYLLGREKQLGLHKILSQDPEFFIEILSQLFKPASSDKKEEASDDTKHKAHMAWELLYSWKTPPGLMDNGSVNIDEFNSWVLKVRQLAEKADRAVICDQKIGEVLYFLPVDDEDGYWPHRCIRRLLEDIDSKEIETGLDLSQINSRGVTTKALYEGGKQERELAAMWAERAEEISFSWPKASALCLRISEHWEREVKMEDERAEKDKLRYS